ncbi:MAG: hypothetical protein H7Z43_03200 [Clostridia bacterium]|nr:hypothetical protein [Deltaproteobacteria bacterium]
MHVHDGIERVSPELALKRGSAIDVLLHEYYPVRHPQLHVVPGALNLDAIGPVGRRDEVGVLRKAVLAMPHALAGHYLHSPTAATMKSINTHRAFKQHAGLVETLLANDVEVYLMRMPHGATEAMYCMDPVSAIANTVMVFNMAEPARKLETPLYQGGSRMKPGASAEGGDHLQVFHEGAIHYLQGFNSLRANEESVVAVKDFLLQLKSRHAIEHHAISLQGENTLHLDCVVNYFGEGASRGLVVCEESITNQNDITLLQRLTQTPDERVLVVTREQAERGATNFANLSPQKLMIPDSKYTKLVADFAKSLGIEVVLLKFDESDKKDGWVRCNIGQLLRL